MGDEFAHDGQLQDGFAQFGDIFLHGVEFAEVLAEEFASLNVPVRVRDIQKLANGSRMHREPLGIALCSQFLQRITPRHQLIDLGDDPKLLIEWRKRVECY